jgi:hypothetical protein
VAGWSWLTGAVEAPLDSGARVSIGSGCSVAAMVTVCTQVLSLATVPAGHGAGESTTVCWVVAVLSLAGAS